MEFSYLNQGAKYRNNPASGKLITGEFFQPALFEPPQPWSYGAKT
jgi:hypothetical protein